MNEIFYTIREGIIGSAYRHLAKPVFFRRDPEDVHDAVSRMGVTVGRYAPGRFLARLAFGYAHPSLEQTILGVKFPNPAGLAAGFDKNAHLTGILPDIGFGFAELGSITGMPCEGNPRPRLWRLPESRALVVYYGLKNDGAQAVASRLRGEKFRIPMGISAAKTNCKETCDPAVAIADYCKVMDELAGIGDYWTINISCPNAFGGEPFTDPALLDRLLSATDGKKGERPLFLKLAVDLSRGQLDSLLEVAGGHKVDGFVCSNLTKNRANHHIIEKKVPEKGGISGKAVQHLADEQVRYVYSRTKGRYVLMGVGGIFSAQDAYRKVRLGASLVQLITGMVYEGPQLIGSINRGLVELLKRDGLSNISEAVGIDNIS